MAQCVIYSQAIVTLSTISNKSERIIRYHSNFQLHQDQLFWVELTTLYSDIVYEHNMQQIFIMTNNNAHEIFLMRKLL